MKNLKGEIGVLKVKDEQVGGFLAWEVSVDLSNLKKPRTTVCARACWLFKDVLSDDIEVVLYFLVDGEFMVASQSKVEIHTPIDDIPEDTLVNRELKMVFKGG